MQYFVTHNDFIELKKQKKVTRQELENLKRKLDILFKNFVKQYNNIKN